MTVASLCADRLRNNLGSFWADEWSDCASRLGLQITTGKLPRELPTMTLLGWVILNEDLTDFEQAVWAWHEIGHWVMHAGKVDWWATRPQGDVTVRKLERQATRFAIVFPIWE